MVDHPMKFKPIAAKDGTSEMRVDGDMFQLTEAQRKLEGNGVKSNIVWHDGVTSLDVHMKPEDFNKIKGQVDPEALHNAGKDYIDKENARDGIKPLAAPAHPSAPVADNAHSGGAKPKHAVVSNDQNAGQKNPPDLDTIRGNAEKVAQQGMAGIQAAMNDPAGTLKKAEDALTTGTGTAGQAPGGLTGGAGGNSDKGAPAHAGGATAKGAAANGQTTAKGGAPSGQGTDGKDADGKDDPMSRIASDIQKGDLGQLFADILEGFSKHSTAPMTTVADNSHPAPSTGGQSGPSNPSRTV
jgi:hypothetical protein